MRRQKKKRLLKNQLKMPNQLQRKLLRLLKRKRKKRVPRNKNGSYVCVSLYILAYQKKKFFQKPTTYIKNQQKTCLIWIRCRRQQIVNKQLLITHHKKNSVKTLPINHNPRCKPNFYVYNFSYKCGPRLLFYEYTPSSSNPSNFFPDLPKTEKTNRIEGIVYKERKKALVILRRKQNRLFAKKISPQT